MAAETKSMQALGGEAKARSPSPDQRSSIIQEAAKVRWKKAEPNRR